MSILSSIKSSLTNKKTLLGEITFVEKLLSDKGYIFDSEKLHQPELWSTKQRIVLQISKGETKYIFKKLINYEHRFLEYFIQEQKILDYFSQNLPPFGFNQVVDSSEEERWFVATLATGDCPGNVLNIKKSINIDGFVRQLVNSLKYFQSLPDSSSLKLKYFEDTEKISRLDELLKENGFEQFCGYLSVIGQNNSGYLLDTKNYCFSHGDLSPINMLYNDGAISIIDWESAGFRVKTYDSAYVAHRFWLEDSRNEAVVESFRSIFDDNDAKKNFDFWLDYWAMFDICIFERYARGKKFKNSEVFSPEELGKRKKLLINMIQEKNSHARVV